MERKRGGFVAHRRRGRWCRSARRSRLAAGRAPGAAPLHPVSTRSTSSLTRARRTLIWVLWRGCSRLLPAAHEPQNPASVRPAQRAVHLGANGGGRPPRLPYGNIPRLLLAWVCTEAVRTQSRELVLGRSLYEFMRKLGMDDRSGSARGDRSSAQESNAPGSFIPTWN